RPSSATADKVTARDQPQGCEGDRPRNSANATRAGRRGDRMKRRDFISLIGGAATWPLAAKAQQPTMPVVGFLQSASQGGTAHMLAAFHSGLREVGYIEGQNVGIVYRYAEGSIRSPARARGRAGS